MIDLTFNLTTRVARLVQAATIKPGASVPVRITFSAAPGTVGTIQLALGTDAAAPDVLAYNDEFSEESETVYVAVLDANDARLIAHMVGKANAVVNLELIVPIDGEDNITPNLPITVQQRTISGPEATEGGPAWYTETEVDAIVATLALRTVAGKYRIKSDGTFQLWNATQSKFHTLTLSGAAGAEIIAIAAGED